MSTLSISIATAFRDREIGRNINAGETCRFQDRDPSLGLEVMDESEIRGVVNNAE